MRRRAGSAFLAAFAMAAFLAPRTMAEPSPPGEAVAVGVVDDGAESNGLVWLTLVGNNLRVEAPIDALKDASPMFAAAKQSAAKSTDLTVRYDVDSGFMDPATGRATFAIREVRLGDRTYAGVASRDDVRRTPASPAEAALARALGLAETGDPTIVRDALTSVLADRTLPSPWRISALKARAAINEEDGEEDHPPGPAGDALLIAALADNRAWARLAPDDADAAFAVGRDLEALGAYDEAIAAFRAILAGSPGQDLQVAVRTAAVYRAEGQYDRALTVLDDLVTRKGPQDGMKFSYHRGWTLMKLGRQAEAIKAFATGLASQPDYGWALIFRACALAADGRPAEALEDQNKGASLIRGLWANARTSLAQSKDQAHLDEVNAALRRAAGQSPPPRLAGLCDGYWGLDEGPRTRSSLLTAASHQP